jgi:hypothetical protein
MATWNEEFPHHWKLKDPRPLQTRTLLLEGYEMNSIVVEACPVETSGRTISFKALCLHPDAKCSHGRRDVTWA